jgi:hypothetical protein
MGIAGSVHTLRDWRKRGKGPRFVKVGSSVRYRLTDIEEFVNSLPAGGGDGCANTVAATPSAKKNGAAR